MTLLLKLREAARVERDKLIQFNLRLVADELDKAIRAFAADPTATALSFVNGHWANGTRLLTFATTRGDGGSTGAGLKEGAQLAVAA